AGHARLPLRLRRRSTGARRRRRDVGPPSADPAGDPPDAHAPDAGGTVMKGLMALRRRSRASVARTSGGTGRQPCYWRRRVLAAAASVTLGVVLLIWSLTPVYNMLLIALDPDAGDIEFEGIIWPPDPSLNSFYTVVTQGYWLVEHFWHQFG